MSGFHGHHHHGKHDHHEHSHDEHEHHEHSDPPSQRGLFNPRQLRSRRLFLADFGRVSMGLALTTPLIAACSSDQSTSTSTDQTNSQTTTQSSTDQEPPESSANEEAVDQTDSLRWGRANLGFVSAFVLARGNRAAIVDTGVAGSATAIGKTLQEMGLTYDDVDHLILTHHHGDHVGSTGEVLKMATNATVYAGQPDIEAVEIQVSGLDADKISALTGGEDVFGLEAIATPGHTPGHMAVIDQASGLLVAGDALFTEDGSVIEGPERFFDDVPRSRDSIRLLADLSVNTLLVGHGEPIEQNASEAIANLASQLP